MRLPLILCSIPLLVTWACGNDESPDDGAAGSAGTSAGNGGSRGGSAGTSSGGKAGASGSGGKAGASGSGGEGSPSECDLPSDGVYATFTVAGPNGAQTFHAQITDTQAMSDAIANWRGDSTAHIPNGTIVCSPASYNCGWTWHLDPATITMADFTIELCDGNPEQIEEDCEAFAANSPNFCPWSAELVELRDCRSDSSCPLVSK